MTFHGFRHTYCSLALMGGVPMAVVAQNVGHASTRMLEKHYAHLAPSHSRAAIHAGVPRFAVDDASRVEPLQRSKTIRNP